MYIQKKPLQKLYPDLLSNPLLQTLLKSSREGIALFDCHGEALLLNKHLLDWLRLPPESPCALIDIFVPSPERDFLLKSLQENTILRMPITLELRSIQGERIPVQVRLNVLPDDVQLWLLNVTDLRREWQLEATLTDSHKQQYQLLHSLPVPVVIVRRSDGTILQGNEEFANWYGIPINSLAAHPLSEFLAHPSDWLFLLDDLKRSHDSCLKELQVINPDNTRAWSRTLAQSITFDGYAAIVLVFHDMTQSKQLEKTMNWNSLLVKAMMTTLSQFIASIDSETLFLHILNHALSMTYSEFGFIISLQQDRPQKIQLMSIDHTRWNVDIVESFARSAPKEFEKLYQLKHPFLEPLFSQKLELLPVQDEFYFPWVRDFMGIPLFSSGKIVGMLGLANSPYPYNDLLNMELHPLLVTTGHILAGWHNDQKRRQAEESLRNSNKVLKLLHQDLRELVENASTPIFALDLHGLITIWNEAAIQLSGYDESDIQTGLLLLQIVQPQQHADLEETLSKVKNETVHGESLELKLLTSTGQSIELLCSLTPRRSETGELVGIWAVAQDITFLRKYQLRLQEDVQAKTAALQRTLFEQRQMTEHLKSMLKKEQNMYTLRDKFIAVASHEFRAPLTAIQLTVDNLCHEPLEELNPRVQIKVQRIKKYADQLHEVANDVLLLTQFENNQVIFRPELCQVHDLLESIAADVSLSSNHSHTIHVSLPQLQARLDRHLLKQIVSNLLHNAIKFSPHCQDVWLRLEVQNQELILEVEDHGMGIKSSEKDLIFQPFYRSEEIIFQTSGIGLGLDLVQRALTLHNGRIEVRSLAQGSVFRAILPYRS